MKNFCIQGGRQSGISLVEIMVSMVVGLLVLAGILYVYSGNRVAFQFNENMSRLQEGGRIAMDLISNDLRMASFTGCARSGNVRVMGGVGVTTQQLEQGVWAGAYPTDPEALAIVDSAPFVGKAGTDVLRVFGSTGSGASLEKPLANVFSNLEVSSGSVISQVSNGNILIVGDCQVADMFSVNGIATAGATTTITAPAGGLSKTYGEDAMVIRYGGNKTYYLREAANPDGTKRLDSSGAPVVSLFQDGVELVEGVDAFRVCLGIDDSLDGTVDRYLRSNDPAVNWANVVAVQVDMLMASVSPNALDQAVNQQFSLCLDAVPSVNLNDRRMRKMFSTNIALRNKLK